MENETTLAGLFYVGRVYVLVGIGFNGLFAPEVRTTVPTLGAVDLGGEISVRLDGYGDHDMEQELPPLGSVEMWKTLLVNMRDMLARCMVLGEMKVCADVLGRQLDTETEETLDKAIEELSDEEDFPIKITPEVAAEALQQRARDKKAITDGLRTIWEEVEAQQQHPGEDITLEEAIDHHEKGSDQVRRIVEGDDPDDAPEE